MITMYPNCDKNFEELTPDLDTGTHHRKYFYNKLISILLGRFQTH